MHNPQLLEKPSSPPFVLTTDNISDITEISKSNSIESSIICKEELLRLEYLYAFNSLRQAREVLVKSPRNKLAQKDRSFWLDQIEQISKDIAEVGQSLESIQISAEIDEKKFAFQERGKTISICLVVFVLFITIFIGGICFCTSIDKEEMGYSLFGLLVFIIVSVFITYFWQNYRKRNR